MTTLVNCVMSRRLNTISERIINEAKLLKSDPEVYAVVRLYDKFDNLIEEHSVVSKLGYWKLLGEILKVPNEITEEYIETKLKHNQPISLREYAYVKHNLEVSSDISVVTSVEDDLIIE